MTKLHKKPARFARRVNRCWADLIALLIFVAGSIPAAGATQDLLSGSSGFGALWTAELLAERAEEVVLRLERSEFDGLVAFRVGTFDPVYVDLREHDNWGLIVGGSVLVDVGSITKTITAAMVLKLVERGQLSLDTSVSDVFRSAPEDVSTVTIHQLLTHSSGLPEAIGHDHEPLARPAFLERAFNKDLAFEPGTEYLYSNVGYSLLAAIIEVVSGKSYEEFLQQELLERTGIDDIGYSSVFVADKSLSSADGRDIATVSWGGPEPHWNLIGNGGLLMSLDALRSFREQLASGQILDPEFVNLMQTPHIEEGPGASIHYGYGLVVQEAEPFGRFYWHNGGNGIFSANWTDLVDHGLLVVAASGSPQHSADDAVMITASAMLGLVPEQVGARQQPGSSEPPQDEGMIRRVKAISSAFADAIAQESPDRWQEFLQTYGDADFLAMVPMERHLAVFRKMHVALVGFEMGRVAIEDSGEIVIDFSHPESGQTKSAALGLSNIEDALITGVRVGN